MRAEIIR